MSRPTIGVVSRTRRQARNVLVFLTFLTICSTARAQEPGHIGITMGYPAAIGVTWRLSDRVALRPDFNFAQTTNESGTSISGVTSSGDAWTYGVGVTTLLYLHTIDKVQTYLAPRFGYGHATSTTDTPGSFTVRSESSSHAYQFAGSFGAQYPLSTRFTVFGEAGLQYSTTESTFQASSTTIGGETTGRSWGTRTAIGVVVCF